MKLEDSGRLYDDPDLDEENRVVRTTPYLRKIIFSGA
jgi:hypothetical protein